MINCTDDDYVLNVQTIIYKLIMQTYVKLAK